MLVRPKIVQKGWGEEVWIHNDDEDMHPINDNRIIAYQERMLSDMQINPLNQKSDFWTNEGWDGHEGRSWYNSLFYDAGDSKDVYGSILTENDDGSFSFDGNQIFFNCEEFNNDNGDCDESLNRQVQQPKYPNGRIPINN